MTNTNSLSQHRSVWEIRSDSWINLVEDIGYLADLQINNQDRAKVLTRLRLTLDFLIPIESYWAFPSKRVFAELCQYIEREDFTTARQLARRIHRALSAGTYRHDNKVLQSERELPSHIETTSEQ